MTALTRYDLAQTYRWNYDHAPEAPPNVEVPPTSGEWTVCGRPVGSPLGISAGPLLNGRWILYYAALGFDVLTYKTTRSRFRECYPLPNLQPVRTGPLAAAGQALVADDTMRGDWAISFGMPSMPPDIWRADVEWTRSRLPKEKLLSVSVVASPQPGWSVDELADDFARCARWAVESGADLVETNFSCPNVTTVDGQLYQLPASAAAVAQRVRETIGKTPYLIKIGHVASDEAAAELIAAIGPSADVLSMTNTISAKVTSAERRAAVWRPVAGYRRRVDPLRLARAGPPLRTADPNAATGDTHHGLRRHLDCRPRSRIPCRRRRGCAARHRRHGRSTRRLQDPARAVRPLSLWERVRVRVFSSRFPMPSPRPSPRGRGSGARVPQEVKPAVFGAAEEVGDAVAVEVDGGGADVVAFDVRRGERAGVLEDPLAVARLQPAAGSRRWRS